MDRSLIKSFLELLFSVSSSLGINLYKGQGLGIVQTNSNSCLMIQFVGGISGSFFLMTSLYLIQVNTPIY